MRKAIIAAGIVMGGVFLLTAQNKAPAAHPDTVALQMVVTAEARHGNQVPTLKLGDISAYEGKQSLPVTAVEDLQNSQAPDARLELYVLLDDAAGWSLDSQLGDLKHFIEEQPATTSVAIGYISNGTVTTVQNFTTDHAGAAARMRLPLSFAGAMASPYLSLSSLIKQWPEGRRNGERREVVMVSSGIDPMGGMGPIDPYKDSAIHDAQRAGIIVYTIYTPETGHSGHSYYRIFWGQSNLAEVADKTGGESYMLGITGAPVSFAPYLDQINQHLAHQYRVTFLAKAEKKGEFEHVRFRSDVPNVDIVAASDVYDPAD